MAFFEDRLPECFSFGAKGGPAFSTEVLKTVSGQRYVNKNWTEPIHRYDVSEAIKSQSDFETIRAFFYNVQGQFDGFRFKDFADYQATNQPAALASGAVYQLQRAYIRGARTFLRAISKPVSPIVFKRNGSAISPSIDYTTGLVTVSGHTGGDVYTWTGEFDVPVAFTSDMLEAVIEEKNASGFLIRWPTIQVEEIRL